MISGVVHRARELVLALALPPACVECDGQALPARALVCFACWRQVERLPRPWCDRCGHPIADSRRECRWCALVPPLVSRVRSWCWVPDAMGGALVHHLKYGGWWRLADEMAARMADLGHGVPHGEPVRVVPVPLGPQRERERGYNQSAALARALATRWRVGYVGDALRRCRETRSQVRLTPDLRSANVQGAFVTDSGADALRGTHVVLVDDVITTAATLTASAAALGALGVRTISFVTFGRARAAWDRSVASRSASP